MLTNSLEEVKRLAAEGRIELELEVVLSLESLALDSDDLIDFIVHRLTEDDFFKSEATRKRYPGTVSDYFSAWVDECSAQMFIKLLITRPAELMVRLVVTSFKKDDRYDRGALREMRRRRDP